MESTPAAKEDDKEEADDELIAAFGQLAVIRKCQMCTVVYVALSHRPIVDLTRKSATMQILQFEPLEHRVRRMENPLHGLCATSNRSAAR